MKTFTTTSIILDEEEREIIKKAKNALSDIRGICANSPHIVNAFNGETITKDEFATAMYVLRFITERTAFEVERSEQK